jgi:opacity protein-like surface antigen
MKKSLVISALALAATQVSAAIPGQLGLAANVLNGMSYGSVGYYDTKWDASFGFATKTTDLEGSDSSLTSLILEGRYKMPVADNLKMTFGGFYSLDSGQVEGSDIDSASKVGVSIGLETKLTDNLLLGGYYFPLFATTQELENNNESKETAVGSYIQMKATYLLDLNF